MRLRLLTSLATPEGVWFEGDVYTCDDEATGRRMIATGQAVPFDVSGIELAVGEPGPERAAKPRSRRRAT